jgi:4-amino-4-deoxy-L-arabinose transferase-like glycosyltransferase
MLVYLALAILTWNNCYFWDVIQQVSKEGHWFYLTNFSTLLIPENNALDISATGYHPPLMGIMTALLWKIFGVHLWVSHAFTAFWAVLLIYNSWKLISFLFPKKYVGWAILVLLLEPTVLSQFVIASPDFILFTAFVISLRGILERKSILLGIGIFFLCCINMRGVFVGIMLFFANFYFDYAHSGRKYSLKSFGKTLVPYLPTLFALITYFIYYLSQKGWFFANAEPTGHYAMPQDFQTIVAHLFAFIFRSVEYGRFIIWLLAFFLVFVLIKKKEKLSVTEKTLGLFVLLMNGLYFLFIFISQMPFSPRYFMPQFFVLTILVLFFIIRYFDTKKIKIAFAVILVFTLTGHCWIYPEKMAKPWDATLAHLPYYELRKECFNYIDSTNFNYDDLSAGFCLNDDRGFIELAHKGKVVGGIDMSKRYFIYSNISNLEDKYIDQLKDTAIWMPVKSFNKGFVFITIYQNLLIDEKMQ